MVIIAEGLHGGEAGYCVALMFRSIDTWLEE